MKWWLICDEDVAKIELLLDSVSFAGYEKIDEVAKEIRHTFGTGLHKTDCVPDDFQEKPIAGNGLIGG